jgi:hypothetical protein
MKTERRHELQTNELANSLAHFIEAVKPYSRALAAGALALVVLLFAWTYLANQNSHRAEQGWTEYFDALAKRNPAEDLEDIATRYAGTPVAEWARLVLADFQASDGTSRLFIQKTDAREELRKAAERYRAVILESRETTVLEHATFGLARAHEALGTPESLEDARKEYRSIGEKWPGSAYVAAAESRAKDLDEAQTKNFYDWLAKYEPPKQVMPGPGQPGVKPDFLKDSLDDGVKLPSALDKSPPAADGATAPLSIPASEPAPGGDAPAADAPATAPSESSPPAAEPN